MANSKTVNVVHAPDAEKSLEMLKAILETLKQEGRIDRSVFLTSNSVEKDSFKSLGAEDVVIVLLTEGIVAHKPLIEELLLKAKDLNGALGVVEIIDHNVAYEPSFLAFPSNLKPIESQENKEEVWRQIGTSFKEMFPIPISPIPVEKTWWEKNNKMVLYGIGFIALAGLVYAIGVSGIFGKKPIAEFAHLVKDPLNDDPVADASECYIPCRVYLTDQSTNATNLQWDLKDTLIENTKQAQYVFQDPGEYDLVLTATNGKKKDKKAKTLSVKAPPIASLKLKIMAARAPAR